MGETTKIATLIGRDGGRVESKRTPPSADELTARLWRSAKRDRNVLKLQFMCAESLRRSGKVVKIYLTCRDAKHLAQLLAVLDSIRKTVGAIKSIYLTDQDNDKFTPVMLEPSVCSLRHEGGNKFCLTALVDRSDACNCRLREGKIEVELKEPIDPELDDVISKFLDK